MCRETVKIPTGNNDGITQNKNPSRRNIFSSQVLGKRKLQVTADEGAVKKKFIKKDVCSVLKRTGTDDLLSFTFEKAGEEMHERCPVLFNILKVASKASHKSDDHNVNTAVVIVASVCLNNRSQPMIAVQLLISLIINDSSYTSTLVRLKSMRLAVSHTYFNKKLDQLRVMHDADVTRLMEIEKRKLQAAFAVPERTPIAETATDGNSSLSEASKAIHAQRMALIEDIPPLDLEFDFTMLALRNCAQSSPVVKKHSEKATNIRINSKASYLDASETDSKGFKLCFDNVDTHVELHDMTEENQNIDLHEYDYMLQSKNYIVMVERIITEDIKCLHFLKDAVTKHVIHKHSRDTATKYKMVGCVYIYGTIYMIPDSLHIGLLSIPDRHSVHTALTKSNIVTDVKRRYAACKKFLDLGLVSRVLAATMTILNIGTLDEDPDESALPSSLRVASKDSKKGFLNKLASDVVSYFVLKTEALVQMTQAKIETEQ
eukprot:gene14498-16005_t